jgi:hypothetical protein
VTYENEFMPGTGFRVSYIGGRQHGLIGGFDLNELAPNTTPFGITNEDGGRCDPLEGDCVESRQMKRAGHFQMVWEISSLPTEISAGDVRMRFSLK